MSAIVTARMPAGAGALTLKLYPVGSSAIANGALGDSANEDGTRPGYYEWTITESITGRHDAFVLDSGGALVASYVVEIVASDGSRYALQDELTVSQVWSHTSRTLTTAPAVAQSVLTGTSLTIQRGDSLSVTLTGLGDLTGRSKLWFTLKRDLQDADGEALVQIEETGGLLTISGAPAGTAANGDITVNNAANGDITIILAAVETAKLQVKSGLVYDLQMLTGSNVTTLTSGSAAIAGDVTRATS